MLRLCSVLLGCPLSLVFLKEPQLVRALRTQGEDDDLPKGELESIVENDSDSAVKSERSRLVILSRAGSENRKFLCCLPVFEFFSSSVILVTSNSFSEAANASARAAD